MPEENPSLEPVGKTPAPDDAELVPVTERPFNAESPLPALAAATTATEQFFVRSNFDLPEIDAQSYRLTIGGSVRNPLSLTLADLRGLLRHQVAVTFECAGNGRKYMRPLPEGVSWNLGAVSTAHFAGVRLCELLERAGVGSRVCEILFIGADSGDIEDGREIRFERSVPLDRALHPDTLLAMEMNGAPLTPSHGFPLRLVVPGWYGVASVKWLTEIRAIEQPFAGHFQAEKYVYVGEPGIPEHAPVREMRVRSLIAAPSDGTKRPVGETIEIAGTAWSGSGRIVSVELSTDGGESWFPARLLPSAGEYAAVPWRFNWRPTRPARYTVMCRAKDAAGNEQPMSPPWNRLGYGNNAVHAITVIVE